MDNIFSLDLLRDNERSEFVLFLFSTAATKFNSQYKIIKQLDNQGIPVIVVSRKRVIKAKKDELRKLKHVKILLWDNGIKCLGIGKYVDLNRISRKLVRKVISNIKNEQIADSFRYHRDYIEMQYKKSILLHEFYKALFSKIKPRAIVANSFIGALGLVVKENDIYTIGIQHGIILSSEKIGLANMDNEFIMWGDFWREIIPKWKFPNTKLVSLGCPRLDDIKEWKESARKQSFYKEYGLDSEAKTIVFLSSSHGPEVVDDFYRIVIKGIGNLKGILKDKINLIVKLHPGGETKKMYYEELDKKLMEKIVFLQRERSLYEILRYADIAISVSSCTLLESMAFEIPVIRFDPDRNSGALEFSDYGGGLIVRQADELFSRVKELLFSEDYQNKVVEKQNKFSAGALTNIGNSAEKIVNYLLTINN